MIDTLNQIIEDGYQRKLVHNFTTTDVQIPNSSIVVGAYEMVNFGSCSYLGLEKHEALQNGVVEAVQKYGTQFSSSRTYVSHGLYKELENLFDQIFHRPVIVTASTTLGHLATIPVVVGKHDAVILDLQVHSSIQMTVQQLKAKGIPISIIKHNCMESLETKIKHLYNKHEKIWYFADGVYSMYGDYAPFTELDNLLEKYEKFHLYIDDAHGMGWEGKKGCGVVFKNMKQTEKMILAVSLNKSFAAAGGCIVFPNKEIEKKVRNCGSTYIFSGPIQPPMLGAAISSAKLHLSEQLPIMQAHLMELIEYTNARLDALGFPQFQKTESPLFFIPVGLPKICYDIIAQMKDKGFFLNTASFPAVPMRKSGIRFMVNAFLNKEQIDAMLTTLSTVYADTITANGTTYAQIAKTFKIPEFELQTATAATDVTAEAALALTIQRTIQAVDAQEWDAIFCNNGNLSYTNIAMIEAIYTQAVEPENKWDFYYIDIKDDQGNCVVKTMITVALTKDDMFHSAEVSEKIETIRTTEDPYYLTSKTVLTGTLITKGQHLYMDAKSPYWKKALAMLSAQLNKIVETAHASKIMIRDFYGVQEPVLETTMLENGFIKYQLPNNMELASLDWTDTTAYLQSLPQKYRYNVKKEILAYADKFTTVYDPITDEETLLAAYELYKKVYQKSYGFNVFQLPLSYFRAMTMSEEYDCIRLYLKKEVLEDENVQEELLVGVLFSHKHQDTYNAMIVGLDYRYAYTYNCYKQLLFKSVARARDLNCQKLDLAFTAELEKKKLGARPVPVFAYVQASEHLKGSILEFM